MAYMLSIDRTEQYAIISILELEVGIILIRYATDKRLEAEGNENHTSRISLLGTLTAIHDVWR